MNTEQRAGSVVTAELESELEALHPRSYAWAVRCCDGDRERASDVLQLTYVKVLEGKARFEGRSSIKTWMFSVIRYTAFESRRSALAWLRRSHELHEAPSEIRAMAIDPECRSRRAERVEQLRRALRTLSRRQQEVLHLVFYQDLSIGEAASVLGVSIGSARTHYERGKRTLRTRLGETR